MRMGEHGIARSAFGFSLNSHPSTLNCTIPSPILGTFPDLIQCHAALANRQRRIMQESRPMPDTAPIAPASATSASPLPATRSREHPIEVKARMELVRIAYRELQGGTVASIGV